MLKIANLLLKYRSLVLVLLAVPLLGIFFSSEFHLEMIPESPHVQFKIEFEVPTRTASEIYHRVTVPSEKVLNGLPGLLSLSSNTSSEKATIELMFQTSVEESLAYLNIQEKMDRIRLLLPRDVKSWKINRLKTDQAATLKIQFQDPVSLREIKTALGPSLIGVMKSVPALEGTGRVRVSPDPLRLAKNQIPLSQFVSALQSLGLETAIGRKEGVMFETGMAFESLEDIHRAPVAARGHRPIRLIDVADVEVLGVGTTSDINLWLDSQRVNEKEVLTLLKESFQVVSTSSPFWRAIVGQSIQPILLIALTFLMQFFVLKALKLPLKAFPVFAILGGIVSIHFLFWKGLILPPLTVLDLHALALTLMVGSVFLAVLYARIRTFFYDDSDIVRPKKTLAQAKLFALAELVPTFLVLIVAFWLMSLPSLNTETNLPSQVIQKSLFYLGFPVLISILVVMPLSTTASFLRENVQRPRARMHWRLSGKHAQYVMWGLFLFIFSVVVLFNKMNYGISYHLLGNGISEIKLTALRGYGQSLVYKSDKKLKDKRVRALNLVDEIPTKTLEFSQSSIKHLGGLDLSGFASSFKKIQTSDVFGFVNVDGKRVPVEYSARFIDTTNLGELILGGKSKEVPPRSLRVLTNTLVETQGTSFLRDNLIEGHRYELRKDQHKGTFSKPPINLKPDPRGSFFLEQFLEFKALHFVSGLFLFLLFAIYLNSFIRSGMLMIFVLATVGFVYLIRMILPEAFHLDSLWLLYIGPFMALFQILVLTRIIDIERTRGYDRDVCIKEVKEEFAPTVYICSWVLIIAIFVAGLTEFLPGLPTLGLWKEGVFIAIFTGGILLISAHVLFPLFYLVSEEFVDSLMFKVYRFVVKRRL